MNTSNQCGAIVEPIGNIQEQEQNIGKATSELSDTLSVLESKLSSARANFPREREKDPNLKLPEPAMSELALKLKGRAMDISAITYRLLDIIQTIEL